MASNAEKTLYLVSKKRRALIGSKGIGNPVGKPLVFRTRAKARAYAKSKSTKSRTFVYTVSVAAWGPAS